jgi:hypothetical protein
MMPARVLEGCAVLASIAVLIVVGASIALRSGVGALNSGRDYLQFVGNLSQMVLRIAGYVLVLIAVQYMIGLRPTLGW